MTAQDLERSLARYVESAADRRDLDLLALAVDVDLVRDHCVAMGKGMRDEEGISAREEAALRILAEALVLDPGTHLRIAASDAWSSGRKNPAGWVFAH